MIAIDTNILVYAIDNRDPVKQSIAQHHLRQFQHGENCHAVIVWQVVGEFLSCLQRFRAKGAISPDTIKRSMSDLLRSFSIVIPTKQVIPLAIDLFDRYSLSHWDSMLVAACIDAGVHTLYSEDLSHNATYDSLRVVNPFAPAMPEG